MTNHIKLIFQDDRNLRLSTVISHKRRLVQCGLPAILWGRQSIPPAARAFWAVARSLSWAPAEGTRLPAYFGRSQLVGSARPRSLSWAQAWFRPRCFLGKSRPLIKRSTCPPTNVVRLLIETPAFPRQTPAYSSRTTSCPPRTSY